MRILWDNRADDYTLEASSAAANFPVTYLQNIHLAKRWRATGDSDEYIIIDAGDGNTLNPTAAAIAGHNLTSGTTVKIQGNATDSWGSPTVDETITWRSGTMVHFFTGSALRFWRFHFADASNPDEYIEIGRLFLGTYLQMPGVEPAFDLPRRSTATVAASITGQVYVDRGISYLNPAFMFPVITDDERGDIDEMWAGVENATPIILVVWSESLDTQPPIYCVLDQEALPWRKSAFPGLSWEVSMQFREVF